MLKFVLQLYEIYTTSSTNNIINNNLHHFEVLGMHVLCCVCMGLRVQTLAVSSLAKTKIGIPISGMPFEPFTGYAQQ